jgi:hypothetical protein
MMPHANNHQRQLTEDDEDRRNRFLSPQADTGSSQRATSQPPHSTDQSFLSSPAQQHRNPSALAGSWNIQQQRGLNFNPATRSGLPSSVPTRSSSFSTNPQVKLSEVMRGSRAFGSTFEDDESLEALSDTYDERFLPPSMSRGRQYSPELMRSRSQSLATRPGAIGSQFQGLTPGAWNDHTLSSSSNPLNIPGSRYGEIRPPGTSRYGSLGALAKSPTNNIYPHSPTGGGLSPVVGNGYAHRPHQHPADISNISPFVRDVGQIMVDDGSAFRDLWAGISRHRDENGGGGSGTTSRRHSVSVVQPRRGNIVGFPASGNDSSDEATVTRPNMFHTSGFGRSGLLLTDEDLASDLGMLNLNGPGISSSSMHPPSLPSSLPVYGPISRSPAAGNERVSPYPSMNLTIPNNSFAHRQSLSSPSDSGLSAGASPAKGHGQFDEAAYFSPGGITGGGTGQATLTARFIPGQGIQYLPQSQQHQHQQQLGNGHATYTRARAPSYPGPMSPSSARGGGAHGMYQHQQTATSGHPPRRPSDASAHPASSSLAELGKGVPLHSVPASWPLYIVEFKAGRTDLFYLTDLSLDVHVGDLVIVEADRGKDLGKVVNDSITIQEVEAFQRDQLARVGYAGEPLSPGGSGGGSAGGSGAAKKEISPKMIYGKAQRQDAQCVSLFDCGNALLY